MTPNRPRLHDLFRIELETQLATLTSGLLTLESVGASGALVDELMRAAHSIKGAARAIDAHDAVQLAHAIEDYFVKLRAGATQIAGHTVDALLEAFDLLGQLGQQLGTGQSIPDLSSRMQQVLGRIGSAATPASQSPAPSRTTEEDCVAPTEPHPRATPEKQPAAAADVLVMPDWPEIVAVDPLRELFYSEVCAHAARWFQLLARTTEGDLKPDLLEVLSAMNCAASLVEAAPLQTWLVAARDALTLWSNGRCREQADELRSLVISAVTHAARFAAGQAGSTSLPLWIAAPVPDAPSPISARSSGADATPPLSATYPTPGAEFPNSARPRHPRVTEAVLPGHLADSPAGCLPAPGLPGTPVAEGAESAAVQGQPEAPPVASTATAGEVLGDQTVRVSAQSLTRLMGLAGAALVEARWLQSLGSQLLKLKRNESRLSHLLEELEQRHSGLWSEDGARSLLSEARQQLTSNIRHLTQGLADVDVHVRQAEDLNSRLYQEVLAARMEPFAHGTVGFDRLVRGLARELGKHARFEVVGSDTGVDREILERLKGPLTHLIRNAVAHGLEDPEERVRNGKPVHGTIRLSATHRSGNLFVSLSDDGAGVDLDRVREVVIERRLSSPDLVARMDTVELLDFLFLPGFTTQRELTEVSGRGVGLDSVQVTIQQLGGSVRASSVRGGGTTFTLQLPITLSVLRAVIATVNDEHYAFPHNRIERLLRISRGELSQMEGRPFFAIERAQNGQTQYVGVVWANTLFGLNGPERDDEILSVIVVSDERRRVGLVVDRFVGEQDLVVRPLDPRLGRVPDVAAASLLEDGSPVLITDADDLLRSLDHVTAADNQAAQTEGASRVRARVLIVDDSPTVREVERGLLEGLGCRVDLAIDGLDGWHAAQSGRYDLIVTDVDMPRMNGFELIEMIRADRRTAATPIVVVSYKDRAEDRAQGERLGAQAYLSKSSFQDETFLGTIRTLLMSRKSTQRAATLNTSPALMGAHEAPGDVMSDSATRLPFTGIEDPVFDFERFDSPSDR